MSSARAADRALIEEIDAEILQLEGSIRALILREKRKPIQTRLDSYKYPVVTLPTELISEIFLHVLPAYPHCPPRSGLGSPTLLTHICCHWREIALATPALWRAISLLEHDDNGPSEAHVRFLQSWLDRSGQLSIAVRIQTLWRELSAAEFDMVIAYRARWEYVRVHIDGDHLVRLEGAMPLLRDLHILISHVSADPSVSLRDAPCLRAATIWDFDCPPKLLPWSQLTSLTLLRKTPEECTPLLLAANRLVHCKLIVYTDSHRPQPTVTLPYLQSLVLLKYGAYKAPPTDYLNTFVLPSLRRLLIPDKFLGASPPHVLASLIARSGCKLQHVLITGKRTVPRSSYRQALHPLPKFSFDETILGWLERDEAKQEDWDRGYIS